MTYTDDTDPRHEDYAEQPSTDDGNDDPTDWARVLVSREEEDAARERFRDVPRVTDAERREASALAGAIQLEDLGFEP